MASRKGITRRQLALAAGVAATTGIGAQEYTGPLDGFAAKVPTDGFDPIAWTRKRWESAPLRLTFRESLSSRKQVEKWQAQLKPKVLELIGGFPKDRTPLSPVLLEKRDFGSYTREKFVFTSQPGVQVLAYLLLPGKRQSSGALPVMVCVPGHGRGVDDIVGIDSKGRDRTDKEGYQRDFALQVVEAGMAALAIEPMAFGCRRDAATKKKGLGTAACQPAAGAALLFGETMIAWRAWDVIRSMDWIETRPELDAKRVGCMGISGGGTCTVFAAALEPRIKVAMVSGYLNTFRDSILSIAHCMDNYVPGILNWCEMYDVAGLIAPRPLFIESGDRDSIFPVDASRESYRKVRRVYEALGVGDAVAQEVFSGEHSFHGKEGIPFLKRVLA